MNKIRLIVAFKLLLVVLFAKCITKKNIIATNNIGWTYSYNVDRTITNINNIGTVDTRTKRIINKGYSLGNRFCYFTNNDKCINIKNKNKCLYISKEYPYYVTLQNFPDTTLGLLEPPYYNVFEFLNFLKTQRNINSSYSTDSTYNTYSYWNINNYYKLDTVKIYYKYKKIKKIALIKSSKNLITKNESIERDIIYFQNFDSLKIDNSIFDINAYLKVDSIKNNIIYSDN